MNHNELRHEISRLELRIEELSAALEKSRKAIVASKVAIAAGGLLMLTLLLGLTAEPLAIVVAVAAIFGGIVGFGANVSTSRQDRAALQAAEAARAQLIGQLELRDVGRNLDCGPFIGKH